MYISIVFFELSLTSRLSLSLSLTPNISIIRHRETEKKRIGFSL